MARRRENPPELGLRVGHITENGTNFFLGHGTSGFEYYFMKMVFSSLTFLMVISSLCGCSSRPSGEQRGAHAERGEWVLRSIMRSVEASRPWIKSTSKSGDVTRDPADVQRELAASEFNKYSDEANPLLELARRGDSAALAKLESYVRTVDPNWSHRFEVMKMRAELSGISAIARYYAAISKRAELNSESRSIESAIRELENRATVGNWKAAIGLYQLLGSLRENDVSLPWGENVELSAKWLSATYRYGGREAGDNVVYFEKGRMGQVRDLHKQNYPHTPPGWIPAR